MSLFWFRSLHYGFSDPNATICLWWCQLPDERLYIARERRWQEATIQTVAQDIRTNTRDLGIETKPYTAAHIENVGDPETDGESRAATFRSHGVPLRIIKPDVLQGWTRVRELLGAQRHGLPWLTIHPDCQYLVRALTSAMRDKTDPDALMAFANDQPLRALMVGAMSRPAPQPLKPPPLPKNAVGHLLEACRNQATKTPWRALWY